MNFLSTKKSQRVCSAAFVTTLVAVNGLLPIHIHIYVSFYRPTEGRRLSLGCSSFGLNLNNVDQCYDENLRNRPLKISP